MAKNETETINHLKSYKDLIGRRAAEHNGRIVNAPGDNIPSEFPSALDPTRCPVETQGILRARNKKTAADRTIEFRIGGHLRNVVADADGIRGDGVNIAAPLEDLAAAGRVCISATVQEAIRRKPPLEYEGLGWEGVNTIPDPIHALWILPGPDPYAEIEGARKPIDQSRKPTSAVLAFENISGDSTRHTLEPRLV